MGQLPLSKGFSHHRLQTTKFPCHNRLEDTAWLLIMKIDDHLPQTIQSSLLDPVKRICYSMWMDVTMDRLHVRAAVTKQLHQSIGHRLELGGLNKKQE